MSYHLPGLFLWSVSLTFLLIYCFSSRGICNLSVSETGPWAKWTQENRSCIPYLDSSWAWTSKLCSLVGRISAAQFCPAFTLYLQHLSADFTSTDLPYWQPSEMLLLGAFLFSSLCILSFFFFFSHFCHFTDNLTVTCLYGLSSNSSFHMSYWYIKCHHWLASDLRLFSCLLELGTNTFVLCLVLFCTL